jgi:putative aldouronate transport system permease protein
VNKTWKSVKRNWFLYLMLSVPILYAIIFKYLPMVGLQIAFRDYRVVDGIFKSPWAGMKYFQMFFDSPNFIVVLKNTILLSVFNIAVSFPFAIIFAVMVNEVTHTKFKKAVQLISYAPYFISTVVLVAMLMDFTNIRTGLINNILGVFGIEPINFFGEAKYFRSLYVWSGVWQTTGYSAIIYIAALTSIDPTYYEAAKIDGATRFQKIRYVDIPCLKPTIVILLIVSVGQIMNLGFEKAFLMQTPLNRDTSEIIATYSYKIAFESGQYSFSTAIGLFNSVVNMILLVTVNKISRKMTESSLW